MNDKLSVRNSKNSIRGLRDLCLYVELTLGKVTMVEIGAFSGVSATVFIQHFKNVYSVDMWESDYDPSDLASDSTKYDMKKVEERFDSVCRLYSKNIFKLKMSSIEAIDHFKDGCLDFVYLDGNHQYDFIKGDLIGWFPKVKRGGFIGGHDFISKHHPGVRKAVLEIVGKPDITFKDSSWLKRVER